MREQRRKNAFKLELKEMKISKKSNLMLLDEDHELREIVQKKN